MITASTQVVHVGPRISLPQFQAILEATSSPALVEAEQIYSMLIAEKVDPAFILAIFMCESAMGTVGLGVANKSPGNTRSSITGKGITVDTVKGKFIRYPNWLEGFRDLAVRLIEPDYIYARKGLRTIGQVIPVYAPVEDKNDPQAYITRVITYMNQWIGEVSMFDLNNIPFKQSPNYSQGGNSKKKIVIHSTEGSYGSSVNWLLSPAAQASAHYVISEDGSRCTQLVRDGDVAWHTGNSTYNRMGIGIEHSWFSDGRNGAVPDGLYQAGAALTAALCKEHGIVPTRQNIIAHGEVPYPNNHTDPGPRWDWNKFMLYVAQNYNVTPAPTPEPGTITLNNFTLGHGFLEYFNKYGGVKVFGLPLSNEEVNPRTSLTEQCFERMVLEYDPSASDDWKVRGKDVGRFYLTNRGF